MGCLKTGLKIAVGFALLGGFLIFAILKFGMGSGEEALKTFFSGVSKETVEQVQERIHPNLAKKVDPRILAQFLKAIPEKLGAFKSIELNGFKFKSNVTSAGTQEEYSGTCVFEKGKAQLEMTLLDGKLLGVYVKQPVAADLLKMACVIPKNKKPYVESGIRFWKAAFSGKSDEAFGMMAAVLQKQIGLQTFVRQLASMQKFGALKSITLKKARPVSGRTDQLIVIYNCVFDKAEIGAHCKYQFANLQCLMLGFQIPSSE